MAAQIGLLKNALRKAGLPLYLAPYGVLPTSYECGIIEVQPSMPAVSALCICACSITFAGEQCNMKSLLLILGRATTHSLNTAAYILQLSFKAFW